VFKQFKWSRPQCVNLVNVPPPHHISLRHVLSLSPQLLPSGHTAKTLAFCGFIFHHFANSRGHLRNFVSVSGNRPSCKGNNMVVFHLLSISQYSSHSNRSGHGYCYMIMNHLQHHLLCASSHYWSLCCWNQKNLYHSSFLLGTLYAWSLPYWPAQLVTTYW